MKGIVCFKRGNEETSPGALHFLPMKRLFHLCIAMRQKSLDCHKTQATGGTNKFHIKPRCDSLRHENENVCIVCFFSSTHFLNEMQSG